MNNYQLLNNFLEKENLPVLNLTKKMKFEEIRKTNGIALLISFVRYCLKEGATNDELSTEEVSNINYLKHQILAINEINIKQNYNEIKFLVEEELIMMSSDRKLDLNEINIKICLKNIFNLSDKEYQQMGDSHIKYFLRKFNDLKNYDEIKKLIDNGFVSHQQWEEIIKSEI